MLLPDRRGSIKPDSPWQSGTVESFNGKLHDECLNRDWFVSLREAKVVIEQWRGFYNHQRPHSALGYRPPAAARKDYESGNTFNRLTSSVDTN